MQRPCVTNEGHQNRGYYRRKKPRNKAVKIGNVGTRAWRDYSILITSVHCCPRNVVLVCQKRCRRQKVTLNAGATMDNVTRIRVVAGILAVVVLVILILRSKKKAPR